MAAAGWALTVAARLLVTGVSSSAPWINRPEVRPTANKAEAAKAKPNRLFRDADLGAGSGFDLIRWFKEMFPIAAKHDIHFLAVGVVTANPGSMETVLSWGNELQDNVEYLIVKNNHLGKTDLWNNSNTSMTFKDVFNVTEIAINARIPEWQTELENHGLTLTAAMASKHPLFRKLSARCRLECWRNQIFKELDSCRTILVP